MISLNKIIPKTIRTRMVFFVISDALLICFSIWIAFLLRFDGSIPQKHLLLMRKFMILVNVTTLPVFYYFRLYHFTWRFIGISDALKLLQALVLDFLIIGGIIFFLRGSLFYGFARSIVLISGFLLFLACGGIRFSKRAAKVFFKKPSRGIRILIIGAGKTGEELSRSILSDARGIYDVVGFVDDAPQKHGVSMHGIKVIGKRDSIPQIIKEQKIQQVILAFPSAPPRILRETVDVCREGGIKDIKIVPSLQEIIGGKVTLSNIHRVSVEDLLGRKPVTLDISSIEKFLSGKKVLITGAAGSIGRELCRQILRFGPEKLIGFDQDETGIFYLGRELSEHNSPSIDKRCYVGDICDKRKIHFVFCKEKPEIVFHAAAYKHVPLMEENPAEAVRNNVFGMDNVAEASVKYGVEKFVFISTDKAVNPTSVMGATKRVGEKICLLKHGNTKFCAVRFGNVLDSQGNVVEVFREQIKKAGPIKLTHPDMKRYFMVTSEACLLVIEAGARSSGGEIFLLNMGKPVKILDLAKEMIHLSGFEPDRDIPIVFTGPRAGEKLFEEIYSKEEILNETEDIFEVVSKKPDAKKFELGFQKLREAQNRGERKEIIEAIKELVPEYNSQ